MKVDVFVSHHIDSSLYIVQSIVNKLESKGIRCWYAPRDTKGDYASCIAEAIDSCSVFLLVLNKHSSQSEHVLNELELVFSRVSDKQNVTIIPFHIADEMKDISRTAQYYIRRQHWIDGVAPPMYQRIDELVSKLCTVLDKDSDEISQDTYKNTVSHTLGSKIPQIREVFAGRDSLMKEMDDFFESGKRILFLEGIGGIGKSELAKQYALANRKKYEHILFLTYSDDLRSLVCDPNMIEISGVNKAPDEDSKAFFERKLQALRAVADSRTLLIVDNFDVDTDPYLAAFTEGSHNIIFTTRNPHPGHQSIKVGSIPDLDVIFEIFEKNYGMPVSEEDKPHLEKLFAMVDYHTYTIELLAKQMEVGFLSGEELLELFTNGSMAQDSAESVQGRNSFRTAFDHIRALFSVNSLSETEIQVLRELSLVGIGGVPAKYFWKWSVSASAEAVKQTVLSLVRRSWVRRENSTDGPRLSLHPLVGEVIRGTDSVRPTAVNCRRMLENVGYDMMMAWYTPVKDNLSIADSIVAIASYFIPFEFEADDRHLAVVWSYLSNFLWQVGRFDESIRLQHILYDTSVRICGEKSAITGFVAKALGGCYFNSRRLKESIKWYRLGLEHTLDSNESINDDLALCYEKVARTYTWEYDRNFEKAEELFGKAIEVYREIKEIYENGGSITRMNPAIEFSAEKAESSIGGVYFEMGRMYQFMGNYAKALELAQMREEYYRINNVDNPSSHAHLVYDIGVCCYRLGLEAKEKGELDSAQEYFERAAESLSRALESNMKMRGGLAIDTIDNVEYLADTYAVMGRLAEASNNYMLAMDMLENLFGKSHERIDRVKGKMTFGT